MAITIQGEVVDAFGIRPGRNRSGADIPKGYGVVFVSADGIDCVEVADAAGERCAGVTMEIIKDGYNGNVCIKGRTRIVAGAAINAGAKIAVGSNGKFITAASGHHVAGHSVENWNAADTDILIAEVDFINPPVLA